MQARITSEYEIADEAAYTARGTPPEKDSTVKLALTARPELSFGGSERNYPG